MNFWDIVSAVTSVISFFSLIGNVLQYAKKREQDKDLYQMVLTQYNNYYLIARALARIYNADKDNVESLEILNATNINFIRGVADSARIDLINFSKNQLNKDVFYQHPAYPEKRDFSDSVKFGLPPEQEKSKILVEISKTILAGKNYQVQVGHTPDQKKDDVDSFIILSEENGGIPGTNIGMAVYNTTSYNDPIIHQDQVFFIVEEGCGKAKIGDCEIDIYPHGMFVVPPNTKYTILTNDANVPVKILWFHNAVS